MKTAVIGAGASGLVAAIYAAKNGEVVLIEKNNISGKKLLITGNGRCNYFNSDMNINHYYPNNNLNEIINENNIKEILSFFENIGIAPYIKDGYYYPLSNKAISVKNALVKEAKLENVKFENNFDVEKIEKKDKFIIHSKDKQIKADKVILALGGKSYPKTGSTGKGYEILKAFNHQVIDPLPALVPLVTEKKYNWAGARAKVKLTLKENEKIIKEETGEVQFTSYGISGICTFNLSILVSKELSNNKKISINFLNNLNLNTKEEVLNYLNKRDEKVSGRTIKELLDSLLEDKLLNVIFKETNINEDKYYSELNNKEKHKLAENLVDFNLKIIETKSFDQAQTKIGGVSLDEINTKTMESKKQKDMYVVGELLDVTGDCGGYNLAFAFITGMLAGKGINND